MASHYESKYLADLVDSVAAKHGSQLFLPWIGSLRGDGSLNIFKGDHCPLFKSNTIIQFEYGLKAGIKAQSLFPVGEPVGVLAATAMSNPAYKAVLDPNPSSNSSWDMMKEIWLSKVNFKNDDNDRHIILYLNSCAYGGKYCQGKSSCVVKNHLKKVILTDIANSLLIECKNKQTVGDVSMVGHIHLNK
ncbi:nuclear RNA polymerase D1B [Euphorbia peplus]|nr:nuclear RNA polymerase D1B [Euphorbia peplus]